MVKAVSEKDILEVADKAKAADINYALIYELTKNLKFEKVASAPSKKQKKK